MARVDINNKSSFFSKKRTLNISGRLVRFDQPMLMGVLNITPDSFYDGGRYFQMETLMPRVEQMLNEGADIIDLGAMSTRPGSEGIPADEEKKRLLPVIKKIREQFPDSIISVDTYRAVIAKESVKQGADMINDVSGGQMDDRIFETIARLKVPYVLMHMQGTPETMQKQPQYSDVIKDVSFFFTKQLEKLKKLGVRDIILDPGFGFGKSLDHNYQLLDGLKNFNVFEMPVVIGLSRKSMINKVLGTKPEDALNGTTALHMLALERGADILRVHDVREAKETIRIFQQLKKSTE